MHTHTVQNHNCHQHLNFLTRGKEATPGTDRPLISPPWEMPMGLSANCFVFIYFCYSGVNRRERTHDKKQERTHGRQYTEAAMASGSSFLFNSVFLCLITFLTFYESQGIILSLCLKQKQITTTKIVLASLLEFSLVFRISLHFFHSILNYIQHMSQKPVQKLECKPSVFSSIDHSLG